MKLYEELKGMVVRVHNLAPLVVLILIVWATVKCGNAELVDKLSVLLMGLIGARAAVGAVDVWKNGGGK